MASIDNSELNSGIKELEHCKKKINKTVKVTFSLHEQESRMARD